jgi:ABC-2 type transport system permease protein
MINLLKSEFYKLKTSKAFLAILLLNILQSILCPILFSRAMTGKKALIQVFAAQEFIGFFIFTGLFAAYYIGNEFSFRHIVNLISYGHKRRDIVLAKSIVYYVGITIINLLSPILITIINTLMNGYGESFTFNSFIFIVKIFFLMTLVYIALSSIVLLISFIFKNPIIIVSLFVIMDLISRFARFYSFQNHGVIKSIYDKTMFGQSLIILSNNISFIGALKVILIVLITVAISTGLSIYFFEKADIK